jgi:RecB family exonuclease
MPEKILSTDIVPVKDTMSNENTELFKISVSKAKTYDSCAAKYRYNYILHLPKKSWPHFDFGHLLHETLEDFHQTYINGSDEPFNIVMARAYKKAMKKYALKLTEDVRKEAYTIVDQYLQKITADRNWMKNVLAVEKRFSLQLTERLTLNGAIDRIEIGDDGVLTVADYKTTKQAKYLEDETFQLLTYAYVLAQEDPTIKKIRGSYIMLRHNFKQLTTEFSIDEIMKVKEIYEDYLQKIEDEHSWDASASPLCRFCDFLDICKTGQEFLGTGYQSVKHGQVEW